MTTNDLDTNDIEAKQKFVKINQSYRNIMLKLLIITITFIGLAIALIAIKMFVKRNGEFKKLCSSIDPTTRERYGCTCNKSKEETCENRYKLEDIKFEDITS